MKEIFDQIRKRLQPPKWASWQTLLFLSAFSALIAALTTQEPPQIAQRIISSFGWIFLILGVWWFVYEPEVKKKLRLYDLFIGPWIVGALICIYLFGTWEGRTIPTPTALISWPPISAIVWSTPKFIKSDATTKSPVYATPTPAHRQDIILVLLANLVLSCWFQFYFLLQDWLVAYPSLQSQDLNRSAFVRELQPADKRNTLPPTGVDLLNTADQSIKQQLEGKPWAEVERWLTDFDQEFSAVRDRALGQLPRIPESQLWDLKAPNLTARGSEAYDLELQAIWSGPSARGNGVSLAQTCRISSTRKVSPPAQLKFNSPAPPAVSQPQTRSIGTFRCGAITSQNLPSNPGSES